MCACARLVVSTAMRARAHAPFYFLCLQCRMSASAALPTPREYIEFDGAVLDAAQHAVASGSAFPVLQALLPDESPLILLAAYFHTAINNSKLHLLPAAVEANREELQRTSGTTTDFIVLACEIHRYVRSVCIPLSPCALNSAFALAHRCGRSPADFEGLSVVCKALVVSCVTGISDVDRLFRLRIEPDTYQEGLCAWSAIEASITLTRDMQLARDTLLFLRSASSVSALLRVDLFSIAHLYIYLHLHLHI